MSDGELPLDADEILRLFLKQTSEHVVILLDATGRIVGWLGCAEKVFGYSADETIGQHASMLFTPRNLEAGMDKYEIDVAKTDIDAEDDRWMLRKDGSRFWATGTLTPIKDDGGQLLGFAKLLRDRTDTQAKTEALINQNKSLEQADQRKNKFISTLAHELRNPLSAAVNAANLLRITLPDSGDEQLAVSTIEQGLGSMRRMVDDLLEMTRASTGKIKLNKCAEELEPIIKSAIELCRPSIDPQAQKLNVVLPSSPLVVQADADRLQQVFVNLIQNSARATEHGGTIWVKVSLEDQEAVVKIEDDGVGISPEMLPRIFDLFTQAEFAADRPNAGLGIGLSVVKDLTTLHGGTVQVRSEGIGKGSEFTVRLPLIADGE
jgi:PAS domain S-box-containing protein